MCVKERFVSGIGLEWRALRARKKADPAEDPSRAPLCLLRTAG